jgi:hypothetical protein
LRRTKGLFRFRFVTGGSKGQRGGATIWGTGNLKTWSKQSEIGRKFQSSRIWACVVVSWGELV